MQTIKNNIRAEIWWVAICFNAPKLYKFAVRFLGPAIVLLFFVGCAVEGQGAVGTPEWQAALHRAKQHGKLDESCIDDGVRYELISDSDWTFGEDIGGKTTESGKVVVRKDGFDGYSSSFIMEHEFLHAILDCSGEGDFQNQVHLGHVWDGLRDGDKRR